MADVIEFPQRSAQAGWFARYSKAISELEDIAESLAAMPHNANRTESFSYGETMLLLARVSVAKFGLAEALQQIDVVRETMSSMGGRPPGGAA